MGFLNVSDDILFIVSAFLGVLAIRLFLRMARRTRRMERTAANLAWLWLSYVWVLGYGWLIGVPLHTDKNIAGAIIGLVLAIAWSGHIIATSGTRRPGTT